MPKKMNTGYGLLSGMAFITSGGTSVDSAMPTQWNMFGISNWLAGMISEGYAQMGAIKLPPYIIIYTHRSVNMAATFSKNIAMATAMLIIDKAVIENRKRGRFPINF